MLKGIYQHIAGIEYINNVIFAVDKGNLCNFRSDKAGNVHGNRFRGLAILTGKGLCCIENAINGSRAGSRDIVLNQVLRSGILVPCSYQGDVAGNRGSKVVCFAVQCPAVENVIELCGICRLGNGSTVIQNNRIDFASAISIKDNLILVDAVDCHDNDVFLNICNGQLAINHIFNAVRAVDTGIGQEAAIVSSKCNGNAFAFFHFCLINRNSTIFTFFYCDRVTGNRGLLSGFLSGLLNRSCRCLSGILRCGCGCRRTASKASAH